MEREEYERLTKVQPEETSVSVSELNNHDDRVLLYGYERTDGGSSNTLVLILQRGTFAFRRYASNDEIVDEYYLGDTIYDPEQYVPSKRSYPESCDYEFCRLLKRKGVYVSFTTFPGPEEEIEARRERRKELTGGLV
jgi:hypothetical protein